MLRSNRHALKFKSQQTSRRKGSNSPQQIHSFYVSSRNFTITKHNDANIIVLGVDCIGKKLSGELVMTYLTSGFDHEERNMLRINLFHDYEKEFIEGKKVVWFCLEFVKNQGINLLRLLFDGLYIK